FKRFVLTRSCCHLTRRPPVEFHAHLAIHPSQPGRRINNERDKRHETQGDKDFPIARHQAIPSNARPSGDIFSGVQGGSHTTCTSASTTPGRSRSLFLASAAIDPPMPQPCAVKVILTSTREPSANFEISMS